MAKGKHDQANKSKTEGAQQWAIRIIAITENPKQGGIEISFDAEPSPGLQPKLRAMGFRHSRTKSMWYVDKNPNAIDFAEQVKEMLPSNPDGPDLFLEPSVQAVKSNLEKKEFSFIMISLKSGQTVSYVVFEPSKPKAEVIAGNFARQKFGEEFVSLAALPKTRIKEARILFEAGKIISKEDQKKSVIEKPVRDQSQLEYTSAQDSQNPESDLNKQRRLEREVLDKFYKWMLKQPGEENKPSQTKFEVFEKWAREYEPKLDRATVNSIWQSHQRITALISKGIKRKSQSLKHPFDAIYRKILQVIPDLLDHIKTGKLHGKSVVDPEGGLMNLNYDYVSSDKNGDPIIALSHYFKQNGDMIPDPDLHIRLIPEMEVAEALTFQDQFGFQEVYREIDGKTYANSKLRNSLNRFLNQWLTNIIHQGHKIDLSKEKGLEPLYFERAFDLLTRFIPDLKNLSGKEQEGRLLMKSGKRYKQREIYCKITPWQSGNAYEINLTDSFDGKLQLNSELELNLDRNTVIVSSEWLSFFYAAEYNREEGTQEIEDRDGDVNEEITRGLSDWLEDLVDQGAVLNLEPPEATKQPSTLSWEVPTHRDSIPGLPDFDPLVMARFIASERYVENAWAIAHSRKSLKNEKFDSTEFEDLMAFYNIYVLEDVEMQKRYKQLYESLHTGEQKPASQIQSSNLLISGSVKRDLKVHDKHLPNVLVPAGTQEPFFSQSFQLYDMKEVIKNNFSHLLQVTDKTIAEAFPVEMFELTQMHHPNEYGIKVNRMTLLHEWEKRGRSIFQAIGFPTDEIYPYVNIYLGYESIEPLNEMLFDNNKEGNEWWAVAEHSRPIADVNEALRIIDQMIEKQKREGKDYLNPRTGKPKLEYKQQAINSELKIQSLENSRHVLQHYLDNPSASASSEISKETKSDPLTNESGAYTAESAGKNFEIIVIPMPKGAQYYASIEIVKTSEGTYRFGLDARKNFGDSSGMGFAPSVKDKAYTTRQEALTYALKMHQQRLDIWLADQDSILGNEEVKNKRLGMAWTALQKFAFDNGITLDSHVNQRLPTGTIIKSLESAYWNKEDNRYPTNKIMVKGMEFNQARLREAIDDALAKFPVTTQEQIAQELGNKFNERRPLASYDKGFVTIGKTGDKRKAILIWRYIDDIIIDNDLKDKRKAPVLTFLVDLLFSGEPKFVDLPELIEKTKSKPPKKQSQFDLNKEIEALIDQKDLAGDKFSQEEKTFLSQYTGSGGLLKEGASERGALYEYYTPDEIVKKMWDMAYYHGYDGGSVLEPAVGIGHFLKYAPPRANVVGFETNHYSARVAQILYPQALIHEKAFETLFFTGNVHLKDQFENPGYSLVIGNPPYGEFSGKYAGMGEKKHTGATEYDQYFILRGLDALKPGGVLVLLVQSAFLSNQFKYNKVKEKIAAKAQFVDGYRLPGRLFETTDIGTDILVLKKLQ